MNNVTPPILQLVVKGGPPPYSHTQKCPTEFSAVAFACKMVCNGTGGVV